MKRVLALAFALTLGLVLAMPAVAAPAAKTAQAATAQKSKKAAAKEAAAPAEKTYYAEISDSMCGVKHKMPGSAKECTLACVKGGAKYVLVYHGKVWEISNQDAAGLQDHAGEHVKVVGTRSADGKSITIAKIEPLKSKSAAHTTKKAAKMS